MAISNIILDPILLPLLRLGPFWAVVVLSFLISLLIVVVYKFFTNQEEMKRLKDQQKEFQQQMKGMKDQPGEMMKVQKEAMGVSMQYMKHSFKATLITMLPVLLIFGWMNGHLASEPIFPDEPYSLTAAFAEGVAGETELIVSEGTELLGPAQQEIMDRTATWRLKSTAGRHLLTTKVGEEQESKNVLITTNLVTEPPVSFFKNSAINSLRVNYNKLHPLGEFSILGWQPGWLGWYVIFSLLFTLGLRKVLKVY